MCVSPPSSSGQNIKMFFKNMNTFFENMNMFLSVRCGVCGKGTDGIKKLTETISHRK